MFGFKKVVSTTSIARRVVSCSNDKFRSFVSVDNLLSNNNTNNETAANDQGRRRYIANNHVSLGSFRIPTTSTISSASMLSTTCLTTNKRHFSSSSPLNNGASTNNASSSGYISPEEAMQQFEEKANATEVTTSTTTSSEIVTNGWEATWWPQDQMVDFIIYIHDVSGLNYALTIGAITLSFRTIMLPLFIKAQQNSSRMAHVKPEMDVLKAKIDKLDPKDLQLQQKYAKEMQDLFRKYDVNPLRAIILPFIQMPVFMSMFFGLKKMPDLFPEELSTGGILWFTDLTQPDPLYVLPIMSGLTFLVMMEMGKKQMLASAPEQGQMMLNFFRATAIMIVPFSMYFPTAVLTYWTVNNTFSLAQSAAMNQASVKKALGIWELPKPVPGAAPQKGVMDMIQDSLKNQRKDSASTNLKQRIEMHNAAVEKKKQKRSKR